MQVTARAALGDAALGVGVAAAVAAAVTVDPVGAGRPLAAYGFALGFGAIVLLRRSAPVLTLLVTAGWLVVYYAAGLPPIGLAVPVAAALYSAAVAGRLTAAVAVVVTLLGVSIAVRLLEGDDPGYVLGVELAPSAGLMIAVTALGAAVRARRLLRGEMRARAEQAAREREREAARRVEAERLRIARDLHDALGHGVSVITLQTAVAREALQAREPDAAAAALDVVAQASAGAMAELRATVGSLRGDDPRGREPAGGIDG
ncbi:MAG TPA: histidine kinase dimerization/phosphoacceptor domain-containing protein, partial [Pseudonocardia sp.]|nr:histidine kinase dimerization/phosphoacceptor domain-containing protein [Pseudonocardia sp.]